MSFVSLCQPARLDPKTLVMGKHKKDGSGTVGTCVGVAAVLIPIQGSVKEPNEQVILLGQNNESHCTWAWEQVKNDGQVQKRKYPE